MSIFIIESYKLVITERKFHSMNKSFTYLLLTSVGAITFVTIYFAWRARKRELKILELLHEIELLKDEISLRNNSNQHHLPNQCDNQINSISSFTSFEHNDEIFFDSCEYFNDDLSFKMLTEVVDNLEKNGDSEYLKAYKLLLQYDFQESSFYCLKAKFSRYLARMAEENDDQEHARKLFYDAHKFATIAEDMDPTSPEVMKWKAITLGDLTLYLNLTQRVQNALMVKEYAEKCFLHPDVDPVIYHLLGRWHFKVASLSWLETRAARTICPEFPPTSFTKALQYFLKAEELQPNTYISNLLYIAKCYLEIKPTNLQEAYRALQKGREIKVKDADDRKSLAEIQQILSSHTF